MDMSMGSGSSSLTPLNDSGVNFSNFTQAYNFQQEILDDTILQVIVNSYARYFWYGIVVVIGIATLSNVGRKIHLHLRIRAAAANNSRPASAKSLIAQFLGEWVAISREATYPQFSPSSTYLWLKVPPFGIILLLLTYLGFLMGLEFDDNDIAASWLAAAQIPLLLLLSGKANLIGTPVGVSYERLNVLHRWVVRGMLLLITLHFGYQSYGWNQYGLMQLEWKTDTCPPTGIAAYSLLLWLNITSLAPIRNRFYEFFVVQHILSFIAFVYLVIRHLPSTALYSRTYIYAGVGIYFLDRLIRTIRYTYHNIRPARASLTALDGSVTKIRVQSKQVKSWTPGSHVFLAIPRLGFGQSHPATIASIPSSHGGDLIFILRSRKGFTNRINRKASASQTSLLADSKKEIEGPASASSDQTDLALIGGPYSASHSDPAAFDTVLLFSGSTGITFTLSNLLSLAHRAQTASKLPLRSLDFVWVVKQISWTSWVTEELISAVNSLKEKGIEVKVTIYVTCDDSLTALPEKNAASGCACDLSVDPCHCATDIQAAAPTEEEENHEGSKDETSKEIVATTTASSQLSTVSGSLKSLPFAKLVSGRPHIREIVLDLAEQAEGEMAVFACGPLGLCTGIRNTVASVSDERAVHRGTGAEGIYLHVESFGW
ncbi:ferric reductase-like protein like transmembrane component [Acephala macrosclerotiorum]|nr:ferric reductase-like protein like transmembrane component [Acephala macrosclerotiorum]